MFEILDPNSIQISDRQRSKFDLTPEFIDSIRSRLINPITLRLDENQTPVLVAGGRRLAALKAIGLTELHHGKHFLFPEDLTLDEAEIIELEENLKREDLSWRDQTVAIGRLHQKYSSRPDWNPTHTAAELHQTPVWINQILTVFRNLDNPFLKDAGSISQAYSILRTIAERQTVVVVNRISAIGGEVFADLTGPNPEGAGETDSVGDLDNFEPPKPADNPRSSSSVKLPNPPAILNADFLLWAPNYSGPKFTFIHCDFPYDIDYSNYAGSTSTKEDYNFAGMSQLLDCLVENTTRLASYSSHLMFWFSMDHYAAIKAKLESADWWVHPHPLIWFKSDNAGIIPGRDNQYPRRVYETAFMASRSKRPLVRAKANGYSAPTAERAIHPSQKPEPMLRHFFEMFIDETTEMLDPTAGSGTAVRAAELCGAKRALGLELDPRYAEAAESATQTARRLRRLTL